MGRESDRAYLNRLKQMLGYGTARFWTAYNARGQICGGCIAETREEAEKELRENYPAYAYCKEKGEQ